MSETAGDMNVYRVVRRDGSFYALVAWSDEEALALCPAGCLILRNRCVVRRPEDEPASPEERATLRRYDDQEDLRFVRDVAREQHELDEQHKRRLERELRRILGGADDGEEDP